MLSGTSFTEVKLSVRGKHVSSPVRHSSTGMPTDSKFLAIPSKRVSGRMQSWTVRSQRRAAVLPTSNPDIHLTAPRQRGEQPSGSCQSTSLLVSKKPGWKRKIEEGGEVVASNKSSWCTDGVFTSVLAIFLLSGGVWVLAGGEAHAAVSQVGDLSAAATAVPGSWQSVWSQAAGRAFKGGAAGAAAGVAQVGTFMWLRTSMNFQYANGGTLGTSLSALYQEGGVPRFYQGVGYALVQAPLSRFGDTAANAGVLLLLSTYYPDLPIAVQTLFASAAAASWRIFLTPVDTLKTTRQVRGKAAYDQLWSKYKVEGLGVLYAGAFANSAASWAGNYPWFAVYNTLQEVIPPEVGIQKLVRNAFIGFCASSASDCVSNSLRVLKTVRQTSPETNMGYMQSARAIIDTDGLSGLFGRGLATRILTNGLQGMFFSVVWKLLEEKLLNM